MARNNLGLNRQDILPALNPALRISPMPFRGKSYFGENRSIFRLGSTDIHYVRNGLILAKYSIPASFVWHNSAPIFGVISAVCSAMRCFILLIVLAWAHLLRG